MQTHKEAAIEFLQWVVAGKIREAYDRHVGPGFRHHNPYFHGNAAALMQGMQENQIQYPNKTLEVQVALQEGDLVTVFSRLRRHAGDPGIAVVHIFRFEDGRIVELWDIGQAVPADAVNENSMF